MCSRRASVLLSCLAVVGGDDDIGGPSESSTETAGDVFAAYVDLFEPTG